MHGTRWICRCRWNLLDGSKELLSLHSIIIMSKKNTNISNLGWHFNLEGSHLAAIIVQPNVSVYGVAVHYPISRDCHLFTQGIGKSFSPGALFHIRRSTESSIKTMNFKTSAATYGCCLEAQTDISDGSAARLCYVFFEVNVTWPVLRLTIN